MPQTPQYQNQYFLFKGRPVSALEEAYAAPIEFDGTVFFFPDLVHGRIYTKQINMDGTSSFNTYLIQLEEQQSSNYITREEFEKAIEELKRNQDDFKF